MTTKNTTSSSNNTAFNFDPTAMAAYRKNLSTYMPILQGFAQNPFNNAQYQTELTQGMDNASRVGGRGVSNVANNAAAMGYSTSGGAYNSMLQAAGRATGGLQAGAARGAILNAGNRQMQSLGMLQAFQPLMTGSASTGTQESSTGGLGTWLPQLIGAAGGAAMNAFMPGSGAIMGAAKKGGSGGGGGFPTPDYNNMSFAQPSAASNPFSYNSMRGGPAGYGYGN